MTPERITCMCPKCRTSYRVLASAAGHHAKCRTCGITFRVAASAPRPPTEDDILRWLREAEDQDDAAVERRQDAADEFVDGSRDRTEAISMTPEGTPSATPPPDAQAIRAANVRRTGTASGNQGSATRASGPRSTLNA